MIRETILSGESLPNLYQDNELRMTLSGIGMPEFNKSQR